MNSSPINRDTLAEFLDAASTMPVATPADDIPARKLRDVDFADKEAVDRMHREVERQYDLTSPSATHVEIQPTQRRKEVRPSIYFQVLVRVWRFSLVRFDSGALGLVCGDLAGSACGDRCTSSDSFADQHTDQHTNQHTDRNPNTNSDIYIHFNLYTNSDIDSNFHLYTDRDLYTNSDAYNHFHAHRDLYLNRYPNSYAYNHFHAHLYTTRASQDKH